LPKAVLMAILCGSYKTKFTALSKCKSRPEDIGPGESSNFAGRAVCRPANGEIDGTEALPLRKRSISTRRRSAPDGRERTKTGDAMSSLRLPLATELLINDHARGLLDAPAHPGRRLEEHELMLELHRRRYLLAAAAGNCGPSNRSVRRLRLWIGGDARFTARGSSRRWIG